MLSVLFETSSFCTLLSQSGVVLWMTPFVRRLRGIGSERLYRVPTAQGKIGKKREKL